MSYETCEVKFSIPVVIKAFVLSASPFWKGFVCASVLTIEDFGASLTVKSLQQEGCLI